VSTHPVDPDQLASLEPDPVPHRGRPPSPPPLAKLATKLVRVMGAIGHIPKRGRNDFFGYDYATEADVADAVRTALVAEGVVMIPSITDVREREVLTRKNQKEIVTTVTLDVTFIDADSGQTFTFQMAGAGQDGGDKGIMKAVTAAVKYAQLKALSLPTGDDPEADDGTDRAQAQPAPPPRRAPLREPGSDDAPVPYPVGSRAPTAPWGEDAPWPDEAQPAVSVVPRRQPPRARERTAPATPARDPNRPRPDDCISEGKHKRLEAIIAAKARDYGWEQGQLRDYVHGFLMERYQIRHTSDIPWRGSIYQDVCEWVEGLGAP
jgi:ERF superfamily